MRSYSWDYPDVMLSDDQLASLRASMEAERDDLNRQIAEMADDETFDENHADSGQVAAEQGEHRALIANLRDQLDEIEHALNKMDEGTYGKCEASGEEIPFDRLEVMPATRYCIEHA